jgi:hypothetical protein
MERDLLIWPVEATYSKGRKVVRGRMERQVLIWSVNATYLGGKKVV